MENPPVTVLANGRYAYRVKCPWPGKNGKELYAFKFCSSEAYKNYQESERQPEAEQLDAPESPESPA